jgi:hypothetical protein
MKMCLSVAKYIAETEGLLGNLAGRSQRGDYRDVFTSVPQQAFRLDDALATVAACIFDGWVGMVRVFRLDSLFWNVASRVLAPRLHGRIYVGSKKENPTETPGLTCRIA